MAYLLKLKKDDMIEIAKELGIDAQNTFAKVKIINRFIQSESYEEEIVKETMEGVLEEKREEMEERRQIREFELERMRLANTTDRASVLSEDLEGQGDEVIQKCSQFRRERMKERERQFERKRQIICYYYNEIGHIKPSCPRMRKNIFQTVENLNVNSKNVDTIEKFKDKMEINGVDRMCLRDSGSSIDVCARSWIKENDLLGEYVWLKSPLDDVCHCLPLANIKIKTKRDEFYTKAAIKLDGRSDDLYLLGNRMAELIDSSEQGIQLINAVMTRSAEKIHSTEVRKERISRGKVEPLLKLVSPSEGKEEKEFEIPPFEGGKEII
ncbi:retrovirus-related Pol polyprotein from transposon 17.6 [Nephila pilipes]|uniref:Retrovirus-related Pol polyprotein from transposon 17.6 n=1 Tax=Nephila pilipes TaxID=299642 RepID=A0A8X6Q4E0_NEPPI|nr:retrovirus-related Pol polyprotein from transposon 17.6 [Nephila pilipes]